jgi:hypothetical protein
MNACPVRKGETDLMTVRRRERLVVLLWTVAATLSVARGFITSLRPGRSIDLHAIYSWLSAWFWQGLNPYTPPPDLIANDPWWFQANYPPAAIAFLSPLALLPHEWVTLFWSLFNLPLAIVVGFLAFRIFNPNEPAKAALLPCLIFLSWVGLRVGLSNGQFSLLIVCFGLLTVAICDKRPYLGGVLLGLALMKPHVGIAFFLWTVTTKRFKPAAVAIAVTFIGLFIFSLRIGESSALVAQKYINVLRGQFGGEAYLPGVFELRPFVHFVIPSFFVAEIMNLAIILGLAGIIGLVGLNKKLLVDRQGDLVILQLCCLWSLMAFYHNPYDSILMLPVMFGLYSYVKTAPSASARHQARVALWILQAALVLEVAGRWRTLSKYFDLSRYDAVGALISHFDRVLILGLFMFIAYGAGLSRLISRKSPKLLETAAEA